MDRTTDIPRHAKRVFKGLNFDIYHWEQKMFDGSKAIFERARKRDSTIIIPITKDGKIILERQSQPHRSRPFIALPGGMVEDGEDPKISALRELFEETGYRARKIKLWKRTSPQFRVSSDLFTYIAKDCEKISEPTPDPGEKIRLFTATFNEFVKTALRKDFRHENITLEILRALAHPSAMRSLKENFFGRRIGK